MKVNYKGFELEAKREKCMAGYPLLYFTIYQDGYEHVCNFEDSAETVQSKIKDLKAWVDDFIDMVHKGQCIECDGNLYQIRHNVWQCGECQETYTIGE
jgi:hypothetical protein